MRQVWIPETGPPDVLELREAPDPRPGPREVGIAVERAGVNFADVLARQGLYPDAPPLPAVVGYEVAGTVDAVGAGVTSLVEGDPVLALTRFGGYSSYVVAPEAAVFRRPDGMSADDGAALPVTYLTAFQMMVVMGGVRPAADLGGRPVRVLVHGASGGVGTAAADIGAIYGADLIGTASGHKHGYVRERGYAHAIDYRTEDWVERVRRITNGEGVDLVLDPIGGDHWRKSLLVLSPSGRVVVFGIQEVTGQGKLGMVKTALRIPWLRMTPLSLIDKNHGVLGVNLGHLWNVRERVAQWARRLLRHYEEGHLSPHIDRVIDFSDAAEAHRHLEERRNVGKVLLKP